MSREIGEHGFAGDRARANRHGGPRIGGHINIHARAEADKPETVADANALALVDEGHDATGDKTGDLHDAEAPLRRFDDEAVAFIVFAGLVEVGVDEQVRVYRRFAKCVR